MREMHPRVFMLAVVSLSGSYCLSSLEIHRTQSTPISDTKLRSSPTIDVPVQPLHTFNVRTRQFPITDVPVRPHPTITVPVRQSPTDDVPVRSLPTTNVLVRPHPTITVPVRQSPTDDVPLRPFPTTDVIVLPPPTTTVPVQPFPTYDVPVRPSHFIHIPARSSHTLDVPARPSHTLDVPVNDYKHRGAANYDLDPANVFAAHARKRTCSAPIRNRSHLVSVWPVSRVVNGQPAVRGEFGFLAPLYHKSQIICAATLISPRHAMTAAHCTRNMATQDLSVGAGEFDIGRSGDGRRIRVNRIRVHPNYDRTKSLNDIAILTLARSTEDVPEVDTVCLPKGRQCSNLENRKCTIVGWGATRLVGNSVTYPRIPHQAMVFAYDASRCPFRNPAPSDVTGQICAVGPADTCLGDSGGPLLCVDSGRWVQCGITSYGPRLCNAPRSNGVYTNVRRYEAWIDSVTDQ